VVNVNVILMCNDTSVDVNYSSNFAMAALRYNSPLPSHGHQISCWSNAYFSRYRDSNISQIWLKMPIQARKNQVFGGVLTPKHYFLSSRLPNDTTLRGNTRFEP